METEKLRRRSCRLNMEIARHYRCPPAKKQKQGFIKCLLLLILGFDTAQMCHVD